VDVIRCVVMIRRRARIMLTSQNKSIVPKRADPGCPCRRGNPKHGDPGRWGYLVAVAVAVVAVVAVVARGAGGGRHRSPKNSSAVVPFKFNNGRVPTERKLARVPAPRVFPREPKSLLQANITIDHRSQITGRQI